MKKKLFILGATLTLAIPTFVAAEGIFSDRIDFSDISNTPAVVQQEDRLADGECPGDCTGQGNAYGRGGQMGMQGQGRGQMMKGQGQMMNEQGQMMRGQGKMGMKQGQGSNFEERKTELLDLVTKYSKDTLEEWNAVIADREQLKADWLDEDHADARNAYMEERQAEMQALREKVMNGEMTREEMREKMMEQKGNIDHRGLYAELQAAVAAGDGDKVAELLADMLEIFKDKNEELKNRL